MIMGNNDNPTEDDEGDDEDEDEETVMTVLDLLNMKIEEHVEGKYTCHKFIFSKHKERRIHRPWRRGVILKLLGRRIDYKALETRLKQMWVKKGVINIIDLSNDYYLVIFSHDGDPNTSLFNSP